MRFKFNRKNRIYTVDFLPAPRRLFNVAVYEGERLIDYRPQFWGSAISNCAQNILDQALNKPKYSL